MAVSNPLLCRAPTILPTRLLDVLAPATLADTIQEETRSPVRPSAFPRVRHWHTGKKGMKSWGSGLGRKRLQLSSERRAKQFRSPSNQGYYWPFRNTVLVPPSIRGRMMILVFYQGKEKGTVGKGNGLRDVF
jgi:hypothetical protein